MKSAADDQSLTGTVDSTNGRPPNRAFWFGVAGVGLALLGQVFLEFHQLIGLLPAFLALLVWSGRDPTMTASPWPSPLVIAACAACILAIHFWHLDRFPTGLFFDEAVNLREGAGLVNPFQLEFWSQALSGRPTLFLYLTGYVQKIFGGEHWMTVRLVVIAINLASVAVMVWALLPLVGLRTAAAAATIFGVSAYQVLFSRIIYEASISTIVFFGAIGAAVRATRHSGYRWWVIWGAMLGLGLWTYNAFRLVPVFFALLLSIWATATGYGMKKIAIRIAIGAVIATVIVSPMIPVVINQFNDFTLRATELSVFNEAREAGTWRPVLHNLTTYGLMFFTNPGTSNQMYLSSAFSPPAAVFLWIGLGLSIGALVRRSNTVAPVALFWFAAALVPGFLTLSIEAPHWCRTLYALPAAALLAAMGLEAVASLFKPGRRGAAATALLAAVVIGEIWAFGSRIENNRLYFEFFDPWPSQAAMLARQRASEGMTALASDEYATEAYQEYVFWTIVGSTTPEISAIQIWENLPRPQSPRATSVQISARDERLVDFLLDLYPGSTLEITEDPFGAVMNREVTIPSTTTRPKGHRAGLLIRRSGLYLFSDVGDLGLRLEGREVSEGETLVLPAGIWRVDCERPCSEADLLISGPEVFLFRDALFEDRNAGHGLLATYTDADGAVSRQLDRLLFANQRGIPQPTFEVEWRGTLTVQRGGPHLFQLNCNDHSLVEIDGRPILRYPLEEGFHRETQMVHLEPGPHAIRIEYAKLKGGIEFDLKWTPPGGREFEPIPLEYLTPESGPLREEVHESPL